MVVRMDADSIEAPARAGAGSRILIALCFALLAFAWWVRDERYVQAEAGIGYALGVLGASMMLLLLLYSVRKRARWLSSAGPLRTWFRVHMWLGLAGPLLIILHSGFKFGSLNSSIALLAMLLVAGSGVVGRVIYAKIHYGLYGRRLHLREKLAEFTEANGKLRPLLDAFPEVMGPLREFEREFSSSPPGASAAGLRLARLGPASRRTRERCDRLLEAPLGEERAAAREYLRLAGRVGEFACYERLFRLWHAVHVPLFVTTILSLAIHVVAVHMY